METTVKTAPLPIVVKKPSLAAILHELDKAESTTDKSKRAAVCYICKQNHHFSIHSTLEQYMKEYVQGLKQNMEELDKEWQKEWQVFHDLQWEKSIVDDCSALMKKDTQFDVDAMKIAYIETPPESLQMKNYLDFKTKQYVKQADKKNQISIKRFRFKKNLSNMHAAIESILTPMDDTNTNKLVSAMCHICETRQKNRVLLCCGNTLCSECENLQLKLRVDVVTENNINTGCPYCRKPIKTVALVL